MDVGGSVVEALPTDIMPTELSPVKFPTGASVIIRMPARPPPTGAGTKDVVVKVCVVVVDVLVVDVDENCGFTVVARDHPPAGDCVPSGLPAACVALGFKGAFVIMFAIPVEKSISMSAESSPCGKLIDNALVECCPNMLLSCS